MKLEDLEKKYSERLMEVFTEMRGETEGLLAGIFMEHLDDEDVECGVNVRVQIDFAYYAGEDDGGLAN